MRNNFTDPHLNEIKRALSRHEKASLLTTTGRALILPGVADEYPGEVDELVDAGYDSDRIVLVECNGDIAESLYEHYFDRVGGVHWMDVHEFLARTQSRYSYIHLDYTGHITRKEFCGIQHWRTAVDGTARVRISTLANRKREETCTYEQLQHQALLAQLCTIAASFDDRFGALVEDFVASPADTTQLMVMMALFNFTFGVSTTAWTDEATKEATLPAMAGTHRLATITRYAYADDRRSRMFSVWIDLVPLSSINDDDTRNTLRELWRVLAMINSPCPPFVPQHYLPSRKV